jgi:hypothetical protein
MAKSMGYGYPNPFNETNSGEEPDGKLFTSYDEMMKDHLSTCDMTETPNSKSGSGVMGGPVPGEPNPAGMGKD